VKLVHLVAFIIKKFVTMHGHMKVKFVTMHGHMKVKIVTMHGHMKVKFVTMHGHMKVKKKLGTVVKITYITNSFPF
jgi:hypothetical protein